MQKIRLVFCGIFLILALLLSALPRPASAGASPTEPCESVDFYVYNGFEGEVMYDFVNWTTYTRAWGVLQYGEEARFTLDLGAFDIYAAGWSATSEWNTSEGAYIDSCANVAAYIKVVDGTPVIRLRILPIE